jgi:Mg-chelatase subunit ChlD
MDRERRWRLLLGEASELPLDRVDARLDGCLEGLYGEGDRKGGLGASAPSVSRWLGDIRTFFPSSVVQVMQKDAIERVGLRKLLKDPDFLAQVQLDVHLVATLLSLSKVLPEKTKATARLVIAEVVRQLLHKLAQSTRSAVEGGLRKGQRTRRPRHRDIDWVKTIRANLKNYQPDYGLIADVRIGHARRRGSLADVILCVDQSGSMASSVVYSGIFAAVLASLPALTTHMVVFDTAVADLTHLLDDPVEVLFGTQLGGGTDIAEALGYCQGLVRRPAETVLVLISDLYEGGDEELMLSRAAALVEAGVRVIALLALSDEGRPGYDRANAAHLSAMGVPVFACTPDQFPDLMAAALQGQDLSLWAARHEIVVSGQD